MQDNRSECGVDSGISNESFKFKHSPAFRGGGDSGPDRSADHGARWIGASAVGCPTLCGLGKRQDAPQANPRRKGLRCHRLAPSILSRRPRIQWLNRWIIFARSCRIWIGMAGPTSTRHFAPSRNGKCPRYEQIERRARSERSAVDHMIAPEPIKQEARVQVSDAAIVDKYIAQADPRKP
jgi:hypothetical protein